MEQREIGTEYQRWISKLMGYDFEICYRPGRNNVVADALSRKSGGEVELGALVSSYTVNWDDVQQQIKVDRGIQSARQSKRDNIAQVVTPLLRGYCVTKGGLLFLPARHWSRNCSENTMIHQWVAIRGNLKRIRDWLKSGSGAA